MSFHQVSEGRWFDTLRLNADRRERDEGGRSTVLGLPWA